MKTLVVLLPVDVNLNIPVLEHLMDTIEQKVVDYGLDLRFLITVNQMVATGTDPRSQVLELASRRSNTIVYTVPEKSLCVTDAGAGRHVYGFYEASKMGDYVIDIHSAGAHDPEVIGEFVEPLLGGKTAVFSTRFGRSGAKHLYPFQRRLSSLLVTLLGNLLLGVRFYFPDLASGYQGFNNEVLRKVFDIVPPTNWITMRTTTSFIETELRSYVVWYLTAIGKDLREVIKIQPIVYGAKKKGVAFPAKVGFKAIQAFYLFSRRKSEYLKKCRDSITAK